ncbi:hypothetical protein XENOCAPTIV_023997, partial [Xenoophorus captivus]
EKIKLVLNQSAWTSQSNSFASGLLRPAGKSETGRTGLINLGNTCYMNSIIQTLFMATERHVLSLHLNGSNTLMKKLQLLFAFLAHTQRAAYAPRNFLEASRPPWFNMGSQQDCSEYLRFLLERLSEEEKTLHVLQSAKPNVAPLVDAIRTGPTSPTSSEDHKDSRLVEAESQCANDGRTLIERMFGGKLITGIRCMQCNCISEKEEPFTDLSLAFCPSASSQGSPKADRPSEEARVLCQGSVNGGSEAPESGLGSSLATNIQYEPVTNEPPLSVPDLVNYFLAPEILDEDNAYFCEKCISLQRAERTMKVVSAPEYLILTLLRFSYDAKSHIRKKILDNVVIPPALRLPVHASSLPVEWSSATSSPLQVDSPESSENLAKKLKPSQGEEEEEEETKLMIDGSQKMNRGRETSVQSVPYMLSSVVVHSGISSESGHYYSYGRNINGADGTQHPAGLSSFKEDSVNNQGACSLCTSEQGDTFPNSGLEARDWLLFNDSRVTFTSLQSVQNITNRFPKDTAYVLMYRKQELPGSNGNEGQMANGMRLSAEPPLQKELLDAIIKDNKLYLQGGRRHSPEQAKPNGHRPLGVRGAEMSGGEVVCSGWLRKSPPEKKLRRYC